MPDSNSRNPKSEDQSRSERSETRSFSAGEIVLTLLGVVLVVALAAAILRGP